MNRIEAAQQLNTVSSDLRSKYQALAQLLRAEKQARADTYRHELSSGSSVSGADKLADINSISFTVDIMQKKGEIQALEEERDHIRFCLKYQLEEVL